MAPVIVRSRCLPPRAPSRGDRQRFRGGGTGLGGRPARAHRRTRSRRCARGVRHLRRLDGAGRRDGRKRLPPTWRQRAAFLRRLDLTLRTPDALHIAIAQRLAAELMTFDQKMAASARALGTAVPA